MRHFNIHVIDLHTTYGAQIEMDQPASFRCWFPAKALDYKAPYAHRTQLQRHCCHPLAVVFLYFQLLEMAMIRHPNSMNREYF